MHRVVLLPSRILKGCSSNSQHETLMYPALPSEIPMNNEVVLSNVRNEVNYLFLFHFGRTISVFVVCSYLHPYHW